MPPMNLLIKPASGNCNMRCGYCFYLDITENRNVENYGIMTPETQENMVREALAYAEGECTIAFQGGEPTLAGLEYYQRLIGLVERHNTKKLRIHYALQTNGYAIDREWAEFFARHRFLVGLSLDGGKDLHDLHRHDPRGKGTFSRVLRAAQLFDQYKVEYNILTVVTAQLVKNIGRAYGFYRRNNFIYQQYIPCLDPIGEERGRRDYSLTPALYGEFLKKLFDLWYQDIKKGLPISIRYFDNLVLMLLGYPPESCGMLGHCTMQNVVEADGEVYPCDFYVLDAYKLGNLNRCGFAEINQKREEIRFIEDSLTPEPGCMACRWKPLCRGGCRRDRDPGADGKLSTSYFCPAYQAFFPYAIGRLEELAALTRQRQMQGGGMR